MEHLLGCGAGPLSPRRARATSEQISEGRRRRRGLSWFLSPARISQTSHSQLPRLSHRAGVNFSSQGGHGWSSRARWVGAQFPSCTRTWLAPGFRRTYSPGSSGWELLPDDRGCFVGAREVGRDGGDLRNGALTLTLRCGPAWSPQQHPRSSVHCDRYATWRRGPIRCDTATPANDATAMAAIRTPYVSTRLPEGCQAA